MSAARDCACNCSCNGQKVKLIFSCSGAADVGELSDRVARQLNREGAGKMFCVVGIGGQVPAIMQTTQGADLILAVDGCPLQCVKSSLEQAGITDYRHLRLWELGLVKGQTEVNDELVNKIAQEAKILLG